MNCDRIKELLNDYLDNELTKDERAAFEQHIEKCSDCREEVELMQEMLYALHDIDEKELPQGFHQELMNQLDEIQPTPMMDAEDVKQDQAKESKKIINIRKYLKPAYIAPVATAACLAFIVMAWNITGVKDDMQIKMTKPKTSATKSADNGNTESKMARPEAIVADEERAVRDFGTTSSAEKNSKMSLQMKTDSEISGQRDVNIAFSEPMEVLSDQLIGKAIQLVEEDFGSYTYVVRYKSFYTLDPKLVEEYVGLYGKNYTDASFEGGEVKVIRLKEVEYVSGKVIIEVTDSKDKVEKTYALKIIQEGDKSDIVIEPENEN